MPSHNSPNYELEAQAAKGIASQFLDKLANMNLRYAVAIPAVLGTAVVLTGVGVEVHHQADLLKQGLDTLQAYLSNIDSHQMSADSGLFDYVKAGLSDELPAAGAKIQAAGMAVLAGTPLIAAAAVFTKGFANITNFVKTKSDEVMAQVNHTDAATNNSDEAVSSTPKFKY